MWILGKLNRYAKIISQSSLFWARHSSSTNNQSLGIGYIVNQANHNKNLVLSIIEFLKEIGWWCTMKMRKNISSKMNLEGTSIFISI